MKRKNIVILSVLLMVLGFCVLLYPPVSNKINQLHSSYAVQNLTAQLDTTQQWQLQEELKKAKSYNAVLQGADWIEGEESSQLLDDYNHILNFGNGIMGAIRIPKIALDLPIYHGVSDGILAKAVGHLPQSAFPIGGEGNHAVLTGHTGLPSAELFTNLTELQEEDRFYIQIADRTICYQVDQIIVVLPSQTEELASVKGKDYCTLVTCTPYGVNSHRLLIRGERVKDESIGNTEDFSKETFETSEETVSVMVMLAGMVFTIVITARLMRRKRRG